MSDEAPEIELPDPEQPSDPYLAFVKTSNLERLISHLNGVGASILNAYPTAEVQSWTIQRNEALALADAGEDATLDLAPFIAMVCAAQFGPADDEVRLTQVIEKAGAVKLNADTWASLSAYVNGLRARVQALIEASTTETEAHEALHNAFTELEQFRAANNV